MQSVCFCLFFSLKTIILDLQNLQKKEKWLSFLENFMHPYKTYLLSGVYKKEIKLKRKLLGRFSHNLKLRANRPVLRTVGKKKISPLHQQIYSHAMQQ